ncbi:MAG: hypothetical protein A2W03_14020 [Candidatus Aminicenantes bacterium RBG_16_63_16]|nr:MAG: hypothetical protein A2W03_14020 [Candidatus Aminicenantes bacterium RBG_16_63_16]
MKLGQPAGKAAEGPGIKALIAVEVDNQPLDAPAEPDRQHPVGAAVAELVPGMLRVLAKPQTLGAEIDNQVLGGAPQEPG